MTLLHSDPSFPPSDSPKSSQGHDKIRPNRKPFPPCTWSQLGDRRVQFRRSNQPQSYNTSTYMRQYINTPSRFIIVQHKISKPSHTFSLSRSLSKVHAQSIRPTRPPSSNLRHKMQLSHFGNSNGSFGTSTIEYPTEILSDETSFDPNAQASPSQHQQNRCVNMKTAENCGELCVGYEVILWGLIVVVSACGKQDVYSRYLIVATIHE